MLVQNQRQEFQFKQEVRLTSHQKGYFAIIIIALSSALGFPSGGIFFDLGMVFELVFVKLEIMRFLVFFLFIVIAGLTLAQQPTMKITKPSYKFPPTQQGVLLDHSFQITNNGTSPLIISDFSANCTCTKVVLPKQPILPGETYPLKVTFDTAGKYYFQDRTIKLVTNTSKKHTLRIKVKVVPKK